jgi:hypothetical protein
MGGWTRTRLKEKDQPLATVAVEETWDRLGAVAQLLHAAALEVWSRADAQAPDSPLHALGLGVYLAQAQATALLPADYEFPDRGVDHDVHGLAEQGALRLLASAEELTRPLHKHRPDLVGIADLVVDLCDLIREARSLGY